MPSRRFESVKATIKARSAWIVCIFGFIAGAVATPLIASSVVALVGFGSKGVEKDSWAAKTQAAIGDVEADSPFALAQSIGMGGGVPLYGIIAGGLILAVLSLLVYFAIRYILQLITRLMQAMKSKRSARVDESKKDEAYYLPRSPSVYSRPYVDECKMGVTIC